MKASWNRRQVGAFCSAGGLPIERRATLAVRPRHDAVHDPEGFAARRVVLQPRDAVLDALPGKLDVVEAICAVSRRRTPWIPVINAAWPFAHTA